MEGGVESLPVLQTILGFYYIHRKQLPVRSAQYYNHNLEIVSIRGVIARCAMFPAGISTPALTNLTQGWEFRYGGNNRRDTVLRSCWKTMYWLLRICSFKAITDNRKLGDQKILATCGLKKKPTRQFTFFQVEEAQPHRRDRIQKLPRQRQKDD